MNKEKPTEERGASEVKPRWPTQKDVEERMALDPEYTPNHDGRIYMLV